MATTNRQRERERVRSLLEEAQEFFVAQLGTAAGAAARRELLEETGFGDGRWQYLGSVQANPAIQNNLCHHWLAEGVRAVQAPAPDAGEAIRVHLMTLEEIKEAIASGTLRHPLGLSALSRVFPLWELPYVNPAPQSHRE